MHDRRVNDDNETEEEGQRTSEKDTATAAQFPSFQMDSTGTLWAQVIWYKKTVLLMNNGRQDSGGQFWIQKWIVTKNSILTDFNFESILTQNSFYFES